MIFDFVESLVDRLAFCAETHKVGADFVHARFNRICADVFAAEPKIVYVAVFGKFSHGVVRYFGRVFFVRKILFYFALGTRTERHVFCGFIERASFFRFGYDFIQFVLVVLFANGYAEAERGELVYTAIKFAVEKDVYAGLFSFVS